MRARRFPALLLLGIVLAACSHSGPRSAEKAAPRYTVLRVDNQSFYDLDVFLVRETGDRVRLGFVGTRKTADLTFPSGLITGPVARFTAHSRGPGAGLTQDAKTGFEVGQTISVTPGDTLTMSIVH